MLTSTIFHLSYTHIYVHICIYPFILDTTRYKPERIFGKSGLILIESSVERKTVRLIFRLNLFG